MNRKKLSRAIVFMLLVTLVVSSGISQRPDKISPRLQKDLARKSHGEKLTAWVYFRDKGPGISQRMAEAGETLHVKSLSRRLRHGFEGLVDEYDVPVYQPYVSILKQQVEKIRHTSRWLNAASVEATSQALQTIAKFRFVEKVDKVSIYISRDPVVEPEAETESFSETLPAGAFVLDYGSSLAQVAQLNVPPLHDMGYAGHGVLICMLDGGFNNLGHEALDHLDIVATWDFVNGDLIVSDQTGQMGSGSHGTKTLGIIAGYQPGKLIGPAFGASFLLGKTENSEWERHIEEDHWVAGAEWADTLGADIISSSLGYRDRFSDGEMDYSWQDMDGETTVVAKGANIAASRGILIVNSAGNEGLSLSGLNTLVSPSDCADVLAAGAVDSQGRRAHFSSIGPTADGRIKPDLMAMGESVYTAGPNGPKEYESGDGTSFACPLVAGVAALLLEVNPTWTNQDIKTAMKATASRSDSPDNESGWGIVDAQKAAFYTLKSIHAPRLFTIVRMANNYGFFTQYMDRLGWMPDPRNNGQVISYRVYAKQLDSENSSFVFLTEVDGQTLSFLRRGLLEEEDFLYKITSVSASGEESEPNFTLR